MYFYDTPVGIDATQDEPVYVEWVPGLREPLSQVGSIPLGDARPPIKFWFTPAHWEEVTRKYEGVRNIGTDGFGGLVDKGPAVRG